MNSSRLTLLILFTLFSLPLHAYFQRERVERSATDGRTAPGDPITITWSIVEDGVEVDNPIFVPNGVPLISDWIEEMDNLEGVPAAQRTADLTNRVWFQAMEEAFESFSNKTGITFQYVTYDNGDPVGINEDGAPSGSFATAGVKADIRIGGISLSGAAAYTTTSNQRRDRGSNRASNIIMNSHATTFGVGTGSLSFSALSGILMHEVGHSLGLEHYGAANDASTNGAGNSIMGFDSQGIQFDDLRAMHRAHGDKYEKNGGNDTLTTATDLGSISSGSTVELGVDVPDGGNFPQTLFNQTDMISLDDDTDVDFYSFTVTATGNHTINVEPRGPNPFYYTFNYVNSDQGRAFPQEISNLEFTVLNVSGNTLSSVNASGLGGTETLSMTLTPGTYFIAVSGDTTNANVSEEFVFTTGDWSGTGWAQFYAVSVESSVTGYDAFLASHPTLSDSAFNGDPDGDGVSNGIEYVLGSDPATHDCEHPEFSFSGGDTIFTFNRNAASTVDTAQVFQHSTDLTTWTDLSIEAPLPPEVSVGTPVSGLEPVIITVPPSNPDTRLFWRLRVTQD